MMLKTALDRQIAIEDYLLWSTIFSIFALITVAHVGADIFLGYPIILLNGLILLVLDRMSIHRNHLIALGALSVFSLISAHYSSTPINAIFAQVAGIAIMSGYYFNALTGFGLTISNWMDMYARAAFALAIFGLLLWAVLRIAQVGDGRLKAIFAEPSLYVFTTLPAVGYFVNMWVSERRYGAETLIMLLSYACAESSLGYLGLLLVAFFAYVHRLKAWQLVLGFALGCGAVAALYFVSGNFRIRARDTVMALWTQDISGTNASTFALLSNAYVALRTFLDHPLMGVGIGGYQYVYQKYIIEMTGHDPNAFGLQLNMYDANSLFLRVAAELGASGLLAIFAFIIICARVDGRRHLLIRNALLPYMLIRIGRFGAYFSVELYFFVGIYLLNFLESRQKNGLVMPTRSKLA